MFYNDFLDYLVLLQPFHDDDITPPMSANQFYWMARIQFGTGSRISETLNSVPSDYDFDHRIFTIQKPKTGNNKSKMKADGTFIETITPQKTTILPYDVKPFEKFCNKFKDDERLFPITRSTAWKYYKNASILGGLKLCGIKDIKIIDGAWTNLLRSSCAVMYEDLGAKESLIARKMRHSPRNVTQVYTKVDLNTLLEWEDEHIPKSILEFGTTKDRTYAMSNIEILV